MIMDIHSHIKRDYAAPMAQEAALLADMEKNNIDVRVVSALKGRSSAEINDYISDFVSRHPKKLMGCALINPKEFDCAEETERALSLPGMKMLELNSFEHGYYPDCCDSLDGVLDVAEKRNVPVKVFVGIGARAVPHQWVVHIKRHPKIKFILLHMGCFDYGYGCIDLGAEYDNVYLETSNQYEVQILKKAFARLPKEKIVFGSSYPERLTKCSINVFKTFNLDTDYLEGIYSKTFCDITGYGGREDIL